MIQDKIRDDIKEEIGAVRVLSSNYINQAADFDNAKSNINKFLLDEISNRSIVLVDTLINYQMSDVKSTIDKLDAEVQLAFYELDFRSIIKEFVKNGSSPDSLHIPDLEQSKDPRLKNGLIVSGTTFLAGTGITYSAWLFDPTKIVSIIVGGLATIAATIYAYRKAYNYAEPKARALIQEDISKHLNEVNDLIFDWLLSVQKAFNHEFEKFCKQYSISLDTEDNS